MKALFLDKQDSLSLRDVPLPQDLGANDVRIKIANVGICGSDVHYYLHGRIGGFVVNEPMVLGHEASGTITEIGSAVKNLKVGDRVCMEPGIPDYGSRETLRGMYNLDPDVRFWATPPIHGCLRETIVHPANLTFKLPDNVSFEEGALEAGGILRQLEADGLPHELAGRWNDYLAQVSALLGAPAETSSGERDGR